MFGPLYGSLVTLGRKTSPASIDSDAQAFLTAASISDGTITSAIDTLVGALKSASIWTKMKAIYPMVGGSASTHKWNLKDPRDLDAAYRLSFSGTWTHASTGALPNGTDGYANTFFVPSTGFAGSTDGSLGFYSRTDENGGGATNRYDFAGTHGDDLRAVCVITRYRNDNAYFGYGTSTFSPSVASPDGRGLFCTNRKSATNTEGYKNGSSVLSVSDTVTLPAFSLYLGANNRGGSPIYYGAKECAFAYIGDGLTSGEHSSLYTAVQAFQTTLGRQV